MPHEPFTTRLADYVLSGHAYLHCPTPEKNRFLQVLQTIAADLPGGGRPVFIWSPASGA